MFYSTTGELIIEESNVHSDIKKEEKYTTKDFINNIKKLYPKIKESKSLESIFKNKKIIEKNKVKGLYFGYICPGAVTTIKYIKQKSKTIETEKTNKILENIKMYTDALFFVEIIYLYKDYIDSDLYTEAMSIKLINKPCSMAKIFTEEITNNFSELNREIKENLPDNFYHIRHQTLVCSKDRKLGTDRIELMKKIYQ